MKTIPGPSSELPMFRTRTVECTPVPLWDELHCSRLAASRPLQPENDLADQCDGTGPVQLTDAKQDWSPVCSRDQKWVYYANYSDSKIHRVPLDGSAKSQAVLGLPQGYSIAAALSFSADGKTLAVALMDRQLRATKIALFDLSSSSPRRLLTPAALPACGSPLTVGPSFTRRGRTASIMSGCSRWTVLRAVRLPISSQGKSGRSTCRPMEKTSPSCTASMWRTWSCCRKLSSELDSWRSSPSGRWPTSSQLQASPRHNQITSTLTRRKTGGQRPSCADFAGSVLGNAHGLQESGVESVQSGRLKSLGREVGKVPTESGRHAVSHKRGLGV